jgi:hypothetical protein
MASYTDGIVEIVALYDSPVFCLPSAPATPPERGVIALDLCAPGNPGSASPLGNGRRMRVVPVPGVRDLRLSPTWVDY